MRTHEVAVPSQYPRAPRWLRYLPVSVRAKIEHRADSLKIISNIGWLFGDKIFRIGVGVVVAVWVARYLGPDQFGLLSFATAIVALQGAVSTLGLQGIVVRDIVNDPNRANETLATGFVLQVIGGALGFLLVVGIISYLRPDEILIKSIVAILGFSLVFKAGAVVKYWFDSQVKSKYAVLVENSTFLVIATLKVGMILGEASLIAFVWATFLEAVLVSVAFIAMYAWKGGKLTDWSPRISRATELLKDSWPLILSGFAYIVYMKIDQIMLGEMIGIEAVGIYSAAVRISEVWYFVAIAIASSLFPSIIEARKKSEVIYNKRIQLLYDFMVLLSLAIAIPVMFLSGWIVPALYGEAYDSASNILSVHIWAAVFVFLGKASSQWFFVENMQLLILERAILGSVVNIGFNIFLIPLYGGIGAAYATIIAYASVSLVFDVFQRKTRTMFWMKINAFNIFRSIGNVLGKSKSYQKK